MAEGAGTKASCYSDCCKTCYSEGSALILTAMGFAALAAHLCGPLGGVCSGLSLALVWRVRHGLG